MCWKILPEESNTQQEDEGVLAMSDKEFEEWWEGTDSDNFIHKAIAKSAWQESARRATAAERKRIVDIFKEYLWIDEDELKLITDQIERQP